MAMTTNLGSPVVRTRCFHCCGPQFNPFSGNQDPRNHSAQSKEKNNPIIFQKSPIKTIIIFTCLPLSPLLPNLDFNFVNSLVKLSDFPFEFFNFFPSSAVWSEGYQKPVLDKVFCVNLLEE